MADYQRCGSDGECESDTEDDGWEVVTPGDRVGHIRDYAPGPGVYAHRDHLYAETVGWLAFLSGNELGPVRCVGNEGHTLEGVNPSQFSLSMGDNGTLKTQGLAKKKFVCVLSSSSPHTQIPTAGTEVVAQVTKVTPRSIECRIRCVGAQPLQRAFKGVIRLQDVQEYEVDELDMADCFRPTDIVRARVLSMGDAQSFLLSTAANSLGVIYGRSQAGGFLQPVSWRLMRCSKSGLLERRKVARPSYAATPGDTTATTTTTGVTAGALSSQDDGMGVQVAAAPRV